MSALSKWLDRFCYRHPNFGIPNLMRYIIIGNVIVYVLDMVSSSTCSALLSFVPSLIFKGQVWRLFTFVIVPESSSNILFFALILYFYYFIGTAMEHQWGSTKFTVFYLSGVILNIAAGLLIGLLMPGYSGFALVNMYYVNMSLFFAMATLYPDMQILLFFLIPLKAKWLAWADAAMFAYEIVRYIASGAWPLALLPAVAFVNYLLFFGGDISAALGVRAPRRGNPKVIRFSTAKKKYGAGAAPKSYTHKCAVCGKTDVDDPNMEFRYCSKCKGYYCYCMDHINNHIHIT